MNCFSFYYHISSFLMVLLELRSLPSFNNLSFFSTYSREINCMKSRSFTDCVTRPKEENPIGRNRPWRVIDDSSCYRFFTLRLSLASWSAQFPFFPPLRISFRLSNTLGFSELGSLNLLDISDFFKVCKRHVFSHLRILSL